MVAPRGNAHAGGDGLALAGQSRHGPHSGGPLHEPSVGWDGGHGVRGGGGGVKHEAPAGHGTATSPGQPAPWPGADQGDYASAYAGGDGRAAHKPDGGGGGVQPASFLHDTVRSPLCRTPPSAPPRAARGRTRCCVARADERPCGRACVEPVEAGFPPSLRTRAISFEALSAADARLPFLSRSQNGYSNGQQADGALRGEGPAPRARAPSASVPPIAHRAARIRAPALCALSVLRTHAH